MLEALSVLHSVYGLERRESTTRNRRFVHYLVDLERHENFRKLVEVMMALYRIALDEARKTLPTATYSRVVAVALEMLNNWVSIHDVYTSLAISPSVDTLRRLLAKYPLAREVKREVVPGVVEKRREIVPVKRWAELEEEYRREYRRTYVQTVREMAIRDALRMYEIGALVTREPDGTRICWGVMDDRVCFYNTPHECVEVCMARLIDKLYRADRINQQQWEELRNALLAGTYHIVCQAIKQNMDYFMMLFGVKNPPRYCEKTGF